MTDAQAQKPMKGRRPPPGLLLFFSLFVLAAIPVSSFAYRSIPDEVKRGMDLVFARRFADAIEVLSSAAIRYPESPEVHYYLALSQYSSDMPAEAAAEWEKTLGLAPSFPRVRVNLALAYFDSGDMMLAEKNARLAVSRDPRDHLAHLVLARALREQRQGEEALAEMVRARDLAPADPGIRAELGEIYQDMGSDGLALEEYRRAVELAPANHYYRFLLGLAYLSGESYDLAEKEFSEAVRLDPEDAATYYNLGLVYLRKGSEAGVQAMVDILKTRNPAWAEELGNAWTLQAGERQAAASSEVVAFRSRLVKGFAFRSEFSRKGKLTFRFLDGNTEERHESLFSQMVRWEVAEGDAVSGYRVSCRPEPASSSLDGKPLEEPLLETPGRSAFFLSLDPDGRVVAVSREDGPATAGEVRQLKRLWANALMAGAPSTLAVGSRWEALREAEIPLGGWRTLPSAFTVESFETAGGVRSARLGMLVRTGEENPTQDLKGEGKFYLNPEGGWMSSSRVLLTGSLVVTVEGKGAQVQFSVQENQNNR